MIDFAKDIFTGLTSKFFVLGSIVSLSFGMYSCGKQQAFNECIVQQTIENQKFSRIMKHYKDKLDDRYNEKVKSIDKIYADTVLHNAYLVSTADPDVAKLYDRINKNLYTNTDTK